MDALRDLKEALESLGATPNAVAFYLQSYKDGKSTVGKVAAACGMDRSSAYLACGQLQTLGLVEEGHESGGKIIWAKSPKAILGRLRAEMRRLRKRYDDVEVALPELLAGYSAEAAKPVLQFFSGKEGLHRITEDVLEHAQGEILLLTNQFTEKNVFSESDHQEFISERLRRSLEIRVLAADTPEARELQKCDKECLRETCLVKGEPFTSETYIYGDKVAMLDFDHEVVGFIVRSKEFTRAQRWMFEQIWKKSGGKNHVD
ncbi:MAG TPA: hypothetical protein VJB99_03920 [Patescibacteria group bacterium]|nr:hypothetical protein [Patescibacteria group bacterium]